jgi:hypothetical protein
MRKEISKLVVIAVLSVAAQSANAFCGYYDCQQNYQEQQRQLEQQEMYQQRQIANEQMYQQQQMANQYNRGGLNPNTVQLDNYNAGQAFMDGFNRAYGQ